LEGVPQYVHAGVEVQDNVARFDSVECDLGGGDAAQCGCGHGHAGGRRLRRCQLPEQPPLLADVAAGGEGGLPQESVEVLSLLTEDLPSVGWAALPGGLAHVNPLLKFPGGRATTRLAARQVRRRHRITVIRATDLGHRRS
jgi:hypothetical protein